MGFHLLHKEAIFKTKLTPDEIKTKLSAIAEAKETDSQVSPVIPSKRTTEINENIFEITFTTTWWGGGFVKLRWGSSEKDQAEISEDILLLKITECIPKGVGGKVQGQINKDDTGTTIKIKTLKIPVFALAFFWGTLIGAIGIIVVGLIYEGVSNLRFNRVPLLFLPAFICWLMIKRGSEATCLYLIDFFNKNLKGV